MATLVTQALEIKKNSRHRSLFLFILSENKSWFESLLKYLSTFDKRSIIFFPI